MDGTTHEGWQLASSSGGLQDGVDGVRGVLNVLGCSQNVEVSYGVHVLFAAVLTMTYGIHRPINRPMMDINVTKRSCKYFLLEIFAGS